MHHRDRHMCIHPHRSSSPYGRSPNRLTNAWRSGYGHSPSRYSYSHHSPPDPSRESDRYRQPYRDTTYLDHAFRHYEEQRGRQTSPNRVYYDFRRQSPSPYPKHCFIPIALGPRPHTSSGGLGPAVPHKEWLQRSWQFSTRKQPLADDAGPHQLLLRYLPN